MAHPTLTELRQALARREFLLEYQPIVELRTGRVAGFEALVRWRPSAVRGARNMLAEGVLGSTPGASPVIGPERFIAQCEENGFIVDLGAWVLGEACRQRAEWRDAGVGEGPVSVNVSPRELEGSAYLDTVGAALSAAGLNPQLLELEITEGALVAAFEPVKSAILALRELGVGIALDDFGTGYSFLRSLRSLGVHKLKIPIEFIGGLGEEPECDAILEAILGLGHRLGHTIVAEGVESSDQLAMLRDRGCDLAQGNHLCPAASAAAVREWLERGGLAAGATAAIRRGEAEARPAGGSPGTKIRVLVVDDHDLARRTVVRLLTGTPDIEVVGEASDGETALGMARDLPADVVLLDVSMPRMSGFETLRGLKAARPDLALLVLSLHAEDPYALRFLREGAHGYLMKEHAGEELIGALRTVHAGRRYVSRYLLEKLVRSV